MAYQTLCTHIADIARNCNRDPDEITTIAVSKGSPISSILPLYNDGCRHFGESRMPEALEKMSSTPQDIEWHLIGTLQKNKVRKAVEKFTLIHSVDTLELAQKISSCSSELSKTTAILLQVNTSLEASKHGFTEEDYLHQSEAIMKLPSIKVEGLMTIAPNTTDTALVRKCFKKLRILRNKLGLKHLSMGMSQDYTIALEEGSTLLRLGSLLFS